MPLETDHAQSLGCLYWGAQVGWNANVVVATRLMRLAVGGALAQREAQRMVAEEVTAFAEAQGGCDNQNGL